MNAQEKAKQMSPVQQPQSIPNAPATPSQPTPTGLAPATAAPASEDPQNAAGQVDEEQVRIRVELDAAGHGHLRCIEGNETIKLVAVNPQGFNALIDLDLMRQPRSLKIGALHDWVELDGELFRLKPGANDAAALERVLNQRYVAADPSSAGQSIIVFPNPASPTGFDLQFPANANGFAENCRRHLNEETVELLQDSQKCKVLRKGMIATLAPPHLIFKRKQPGGSESHLAPGPENTVCTPGDDGRTRTIDLSQPVDLLHLSARELSAVLNHPAINRRAKLAETATVQGSQSFG